MEQFHLDQKFYGDWKRSSAEHFKGLDELLESWRGNAYLADLMAAPEESRRVFRETRTIRGGVRSRKQGAADTAVRGRLGRGFLARQAFEAEEAGDAATAAVVGDQASRRLQIGADVESQYAQTRSEIETARFADARNQEDFRLAKNARLRTGREANRSAMLGRGVALGGAAIGAALGGVGVGGLEGWADGARTGAMVGGALGGNQAFGQGLNLAFGGTPVSRLPDVVGASPVLAYALGMAQQPGAISPVTASNPSGLALPPGPSNYNQHALQGAAEGGR